MTRLALVTGATGFVGSHLVDQLLHEGWNIRCTLRRTSDLKWLNGKPFERFEADLRTGDHLERACEGVDTVFHVAGVTRAPNPAKYRAGNWLATKRMVEAAVRAGVRRFVHVSSLAASGPQRDGRVADESQPEHPVSIYGRSKLEGEREALARSDQMAVTVVRPPPVYGPRDVAFTPIFSLMARGLRLCVGGQARFSLIHIRDLVEGIVALAGSDRTHGKAYFLAHDESLSMDELSQVVHRVSGRRSSVRLSFSNDVVRGLARLCEYLPGAPLSYDRATEMTQAGWVCSAERARRDAGFVARIGHEEGIRGTLAY